MVLNITTSSSPENLPLATIRRFARTTFAYLYAYKSRMGIISAHDWVKRHLSHHGQSQQIDLALESIYNPRELQALYYPRGRPGQAQVPAIVTPTTALPMLTGP
jgi:hypothetical protein